MTAQAALIADTIAGMKRTLRGHCDSSDSDDGIANGTNRGQKLKRKAQFIHEGQLAGEKVSKCKVEHAGYYRFILRRNPKRYDEYGDELDNEEADERADAAAAEGNPYGDVKLDELLMPLISAAELSNHPSLSTPYRSVTLSNMVQQTSEMVHKEKRTLWTAKHLLTKFRGDSDWIPGGYLLSDNDATLFPIENIQGSLTVSSIPTQLNGRKDVKEKDPHHENTSVAIPAHNGDPAVNASLHTHQSTIASQTSCGASRHDRSPQDASVSLTAADPRIPQSAQISPYTIADIEGAIAELYSRPIDGSTHLGELDQPSTVKASTQELNEVLNDNRRDDNAGVVLSNDSAPTSLELLKEESEPSGSVPPVDEDNQIEDIQVPARRMRTRAQTQAVSDKTLSSHTRSSSPNASEPSYIHPIYLTPYSAAPDRDFALPSIEAEETRRILMMWVQKQEEVVRGVERLYKGLLKADRTRKAVIKWCKAEGHVGEMSDGEDWYDKEEWGLDEDLKKGQLEEEDESANQGKKTRGRRVAQ